MHLDVVELKRFYFQSRLGRFAARELGERAVDIWPNMEGQSLVGYGFAVPILRKLAVKSERVVNLMPGGQGVLAWPRGRPNTSVLSEETQWPIPTGFADRVVFLHGLETSDIPSLLLAECWRAMAPGGRVLFVVPNRSGLWARSDATPFGYGRPYSVGQLEGQLINHRFEPERRLAALFAPPSEKRFWTKVGPTWERVGRRRLLRFVGGVHMVEAIKQVYAPHRPGIRNVVTSRLKVLEGIAVPGAKPVSGRLPH